MTHWLIKFEDQEIPDEIFTDEVPARERFTQVGLSWNAHLFMQVDSSVREDREKLPKTIRVNGRIHQIVFSRISYEDIAVLDGQDPSWPITMTVCYPRAVNIRDRIINRGQDVPVVNGMIITAMITGNA